MSCAWCFVLHYASVVLHNVCIYATCVFIMVAAIMTKWFHLSSCLYWRLNYLQWTSNVHFHSVQQGPHPSSNSQRLVYNDSALYQNECYWMQYKWSLTFECSVYHVLCIIFYMTTHYLKLYNVMKIELPLYNMIYMLQIYLNICLCDVVWL